MRHLILEICIARADNVSIGIPCTHGPSCCKVSIQRNCVCVVADLLKSFQKFIRCLGKFCNACCIPYFLVIKNAACRTTVGDTVYFAFKALLCTEVVNAIQCVKVAKADKVIL